MVFSTQKLIYLINIWFNFGFGSFVEQDHLLNLIILGVYAKKWSKYACISKLTDVAQNLIDNLLSKKNFP